MIDKDVTIHALTTEWATIDQLLTGLDENQWAAPSPCPGWNVQDLVAHMIGTELLLTGQEPPGVQQDVRQFPHVHNDIGVRNELWAEHFRAQTPAQVLDRFRTITAHRAKVLTEMSDEDFHAPSWTPAGQATYARFMRIRAFDCWMHEQDIRDAIGEPGTEDGPAAALAIDEITDALGYIVGKRGKAPEGSSVIFDLTGPRARRLHVMVDGRAKVVDELPDPATTRITLPLGTFTRLCGGRSRAQDIADTITIDGDQRLGRQIVNNMAFTI